MKFDFNTMTHDGVTLYAPIVDGKEHKCYFEDKGKAIIYAGLIESGVSLNDSSYLSRYIGYMIDGIVEK